MSLLLFRIGCVAAVLLGGLHLIGHNALTQMALSPEIRAPLLGMSWHFSLSFVALGIVGLLCGASVSRGVQVAFALFFALETLLYHSFDLAPPLILSGICLVFFAGAVVARVRSELVAAGS